MSCLVQQSGGVELLFYGELNGAERLELQHHLTRCAECRLALEELQLIKAALGTRPTVCAPPGGDWTGFMARLSKAVAAEPRHAGAGAVIGPGLQPSSGRSIGGYAGYIAMAALLVLVTLSVAYLAQSRNAVHETQAALTPTTAAGGGDVEEPWSVDAAFASLSEQHFQRSKLVVLGLLNKDPKTTPDWAYERQLASALLSDTRLYRQAAEARGLTKLARIMDDLELVLLQTSVVEEPQPATLEQIQRLIEKRDLLTKMNVVTTVAGL